MRFQTKTDTHGQDLRLYVNGRECGKNLMPLVEFNDPDNQMVRQDI